MSSNLISTEPGGESSQYESIKTVTKPHSKEVGQLSADSQAAATSEQELQENAEQGERTAENIRYGQAISEQGYGGKTTDGIGSALKPIISDPQDGKGEAAKSRQAQGYGPDSGVGA